MKTRNIIITAFLLVSLLILSGCNDSHSTATSESFPTNIEVLSESTDNGTNDDRSKAIKDFRRPAYAFKIDSATSEPIGEDVVIKYDDKGRIIECSYTTDSNLECKAIYTYNDTYAHIFSFGGINLVDDLIVKCEYSEDSDWTVIDGYYFKHIQSTESVD